MRAVVIREFRNREAVAVEEVADPVPVPGEILVEVEASGINFTDLLSLDGAYQNLPPLPFTPGKDAAGTVAATGPGVVSVSPGDRVIAHVNHGALAEKVAVHQGLCFPLPESVAFEDAAAMGLVYQTAHFALTARGGLQPGESVLVNGASGGVGTAAVELAKALGAGKVLAGLTTPAKAGSVLAFGADAAVDLSAGDLRDSLRAQVLAHTGGEGVDLVLDLVGGQVFDAALRAVAWRGRAVVAGFTSGTIPSVKTNYLLLKNISVVGMTINSYLDRKSAELEETQRAIFDLHRQGKIHSHIMSRFPLDRFMDAIRLLEERKIVGKTVLTMDAGRSANRR